MISPETIDRIREAMRIEEVVGEFVSLRKRGVNLVGLCPFHNEKTPSFHVHPVKGIFKCFGCSEGGNAIDFLIKHEQLSYVEALRWLAKKYHIEIREEELSEEQSAVHELRERLFNLNAFATTWFGTQLTDSEGSAIALTYCRERGITDESIGKFQIGYSPNQPDAFTSHALLQGYDRELLVTGGLSTEREGALYDRFRGRLIFPIHNISGRVVGFGARLLVQDTKRPKYLNSPETEIYLKSRILYGIYQARNAIAQHDNCYLVEGYTDVIGLHQAGIQNVVASSGTSLTTDQIKAIRRYTPNVTIIYDGDLAGIKASFRGIDMILSEGMNVRIVPMPEGEDPDSFARKNRSSDVLQFLNTHSDDFITFKAGLLKAEAEGDPVKMGNLIREIIGSVALIPDPLLRTLFVKKCAAITAMEEEQLNYELNRQLRNLKIKTTGAKPEEVPETVRTAPPQQTEAPKPLVEYQEDDIIRLLVTYGDQPLTHTKEDGEPYITTLAADLTEELTADGITFSNPLWQQIYEDFRNALAHQKPLPSQAWFIHHENAEVRSAVISMISSPYELSSKWEKMRIYVETEKDLLSQAADAAIYSFRLRKVEEMMQEIRNQLVTAEDEEEAIRLLTRFNQLMKSRNRLAGFLGRIISF
ncbi:MAG TPA: DNA primase [Bacteroidales bacterium]|nr:DNA primase [Bacteroidales bacterium]HRZ48766.1 DNA primase [Bacteroidales bacterium]